MEGWAKNGIEGGSSISPEPWFSGAFTESSAPAPAVAPGAQLSKPNTEA